MKLNIEPLNQKDYSQNLPGGGSMSDYGCLVVALSMSLGIPVSQLLKKKIFNGNYISWNKFKEVFEYDFEWVKDGDFKRIIRDRVDKGLPTIIRIKEFEHFILAIGYDDNSKEIFINDPLKGETYYLKATQYSISSLRLLTPKNGQGLPVEQPSALDECLKQHGDLLDQLKEKQTKLEQVKKELNSCKSIRANLEEDVDELSLKVGVLEDGKAKFQSKLESANSKIKKLEEENEQLKDERNNFKNYHSKVLEYDIRKYEPARGFVAGLYRLLGLEPIARGE